MTTKGQHRGHCQACGRVQVDAIELLVFTRNEIKARPVIK